MNINTATVLPGGWHFKSAAGYRIPHRGELAGPKEVIDGILTYRLENNIAVGNPELDMEAYVCEQFPQWCRQEPITPRPIQQNGPLRQVDIVINWGNHLYTSVGRLALVPTKEAEARAEICKSCPLQKPWAQDCPPCVTSAQRLLTILRQGRDTPQGQAAELHSCAAYGWDNRTAVHLDKEHLPALEQRHPECPANCWVRSL